MTAETHELPSQIPGQLMLLREMRQSEAAITSERKMRGYIGGITSCLESTPFSRLESGFTYDAPVMRTNILMAAEALGFDSESLARSTGWEKGRAEPIIAENKIGIFELRLKAAKDGVSIGLIGGAEQATGSDPQYDEYRAQVGQQFKARYDKSPMHRALLDVTQNFDGALPETVIVNSVDLFEDPLGSLTFLDSTGLNTDAVKRIRSGETAEFVLHDVLSGLDDRWGVRRQERDGVVSHSWGNDIICRVLGDESGRMSFVMQRNPMSDYAERANQSSESSIPFIETACAKEICAWLDDSGLAFAPGVVGTLVKTGEADRYGSVYTALSREIAKWINRTPQGRIRNVFVRNTDALGEALLKRDLRSLEQFSLDAWYEGEAGDDPYVIEKLAAYNPDERLGGEASVMLLSLARSAVTRPNFSSELPTTDRDVSIKTGACFDVLSYYMQASDSTFMGGEPKLDVVSENGVDMLHKTHGKETFLLVRPTMFRGVELPKGSLMSRQVDGGWAFLRLTPFAFDNPIDQEAFGSELSKAYASESRTVARVGGVSLSMLVEEAR